MIKLNLSDAISITNYNPKFKENNLYLGYIKGQGYIFINETNDKAYFTPITSDKEPDYLNLNWQNPNYENGEFTGEPKEIAIIYNQLNKILKGYITETLAGNKGDFQSKIVNGVFVDIVEDLLESLEHKYLSYDYVKANRIKNQQIKEFALNPTNQFNFYLKTEPKKVKNLKAEKDRIENEITKHLVKAVEIFNTEKGTKPYYLTGTDTETVTQLIDEKRFIKLFNETISDAFSNPLVNIVYGYGKEKLNTIKAIDYISEEFNIKGVVKNGVENIYYFDNDLNYFEPLTDIKLKNLISQHLGIKLLKSDYDKIFKSIQTTDKQHDNILVFNNMLFDMDYMEELNYPICNYNRRDYLAPTLIGFENDNNNITLLDFDTDFDYLKIYDTDPNPKEMTFTEKTLRQILIPKDEPTNLLMFHDFLQRLGSCILGKNKYKVITLYYGEGNNGKGILKLVMELIFNRGAYSLTPATFEENFNAPSFANRKVLLLDEIEKNDFKELKPTLKRISSPESRVEQRAIYSSENIVLTNFPMLFIFSNVLVKLEMSETALFDRFDFLKLPNSFVSEKELNKIPNSYLKDRNTEAKIKQDVKGLSWLITASIKAFVDMQTANNEFILKQTASETMDILAETDHLTKFISLFTEIDTDLVPSEYTTNKEILQQFKQYLEVLGVTTTETDKQISRRIGTTIKKVYDIQGKITESDIYYKQNKTVASYAIKLKSFDELNKEFNRVYITNEDITDVDLVPLDRNNEYKIIYNKIQNGTNTINLLNKALPELDNYKIIKELLNLNLIIKTSQINLMDTN